MFARLKTATVYVVSTVVAIVCALLDDAAARRLEDS